MTTRIGINGFGRIGRQVLRATMERHPDELEVVAVNDLADPKSNAHLFKYDTNFGRYPGTVEATDGAIIVDGMESGAACRTYNVLMAEERRVAAALIAID